MKFALIGYGKMGKMIESIAKARGHEIVCIVDIDNLEDFDSPAFQSADVAIEFTNPTAAYGNIVKAMDRGVKVVTGSTGWIAEHKDEMVKRCADEGKTLFWSSNFSLGVFLFGKLNRYLAELMKPFQDYDVSMEEVHHVHKLDAPSGTAITLAEQVIEAGGKKTGWTSRLVSGDAEAPAAADDTLRIDCFRRGEVPGIHSIIYDSPYDSITITHDAHSRRGFALGAVLAAEYTATHQGMLTMENLF